MGQVPRLLRAPRRGGGKSFEVVGLALSRLSRVRGARVAPLLMTVERGGRRSRLPNATALVGAQTAQGVEQARGQVASLIERDLPVPRRASLLACTPAVEPLLRGSPHTGLRVLLHRLDRHHRGRGGRRRSPPPGRSGTRRVDRARRRPLAATSERGVRLRRCSAGVRFRRAAGALPLPGRVRQGPSREQAFGNVTWREA